MGRINLNPRLVKGGRSYDVEEVADLYDVCRGTVRAWLKSGLDPIDGRRPTLIQGKVLRAFVEARRIKSKRQNPPGHLYCFKCRMSQRPRPETVEFLLAEEGAGMLRGRCLACATMMNRRANAAQIAAVLPGVAVPFKRGLPRK